MGMTLWVLWSRDMPHTRQMGSWSSSQYSFSFSSCSSHISIPGPRRGQCPVEEATLLMLDPRSRCSGSSSAPSRSHPVSPEAVFMPPALLTLSTTLHRSELGLSLRPHDFRHFGQLDSSSALASQHWMMHTWQKWCPHSRITGSRNSSRHTGQVSSDCSSSSACASAIVSHAHNPERGRNEDLTAETVTSREQAAFPFRDRGSGLKLTVFTEETEGGRAETGREPLRDGACGRCATRTTAANRSYVTCLIK